MRLFRWIRSWFSPSDSFDVYAPEERLIYTFWNGKERIKADPMELWKRVMKVGPQLSIDITVSQSPSKDAAKAHEGMLDKIRDIFSLKSFKEGGLSEIETAGLMDHFLIYCERLKKNMSPSQTSFSNTAASPVSSVENPDTSSSSVSGSIENAASTAAPTPSQSESSPPSGPSI